MAGSQLRWRQARAHSRPQPRDLTPAPLKMAAVLLGSAPPRLPPATLALANERRGEGRGLRVLGACGPLAERGRSLGGSARKGRGLISGR